MDNRVAQLEGLVADLQRQLNELRGFSDIMVIDKRLKLNKDIILPTTGIRIGTASTQKVGFFGTAPTAQQVAPNVPGSPGGTYDQATAATATTAISNIITVLRTIGFIA